MKESPSYVRFLVIGAAAMMSVLLYLDRFCLSTAETYIKQDVGVTDTEIGWLMSAFFWTYALCQVPSSNWIMIGPPESPLQVSFWPPTVMVSPPL